MENETVVPIFTEKSKPSERMTGTIDLYQFPASPPARSVMMLARAVKLKLNIKTVNLMEGEHLTPEFIKMNPQHVIPTLNDNGFILWESRAIMKYLVDQYGNDDSLNPKEPKKAAIVNQRLYFDACTLYDRLRLYFQPVIFGQGKPNPELAKKFEEALAWLNQFLENQVWVAGQYMTVADFAIVTTVSTAEAVMFDISKYPNVHAWYQRSKKAMAEYGYEEINQAGAAMIGGMFRSKLK